MALRGDQHQDAEADSYPSRYTCPANKETAVRIILTLLITCLSTIETIRADYQATTLATGLNYPW